MNYEVIAIAAFVGLLAGCLSGSVAKRGGYGLVGDAALGVVGGAMGAFVLWTQGIGVPGSWFVIVGAALLGAFILVVLQRAFWNVEAGTTR
jgi:uncharacterized membrane protein YeaQ/YmgE (transglycosylase-associated protein family)